MSQKQKNLLPLQIVNSKIMRTRIKICCISSLVEAQIATAAGADALGLVGKMPSGPGPIPDNLIASIAAKIPPPIASFLLTSEQTAEGIIDHVLRAGTNTVQIVDELTNRQYDEIRKRLPNVKLVQVIHVIDNDSVTEALEISNHVDALLLDSGSPKAEIKLLGGTGKVHNWEISRAIVDQVTIPVFLAGGLNAENVSKAIEIVKPYAVDVCSGVRTNGNLDPEKLEAFVIAVGK